MLTVRAFLLAGCIGCAGLALANSEPAQTAVPAQQGAAANTTSAEQLQKWFDQGYSAFKKERYHSAVSNLHKFKLNRHDDTLNSDWALFFLAMSYDRSGLTQAAVDTFNQLLKKQANPQIVNAAVNRLEQISRSLPHDQALLVDQTIITLDFDYIDDALKPFILFSQGRYNWSKGFINWGNEQFAKLPEGDFYQQKYQLLNAQRLVFSGQIDQAFSNLNKLVEAQDLHPELASEAQQFLARLSFEQQRFEQAGLQYQAALNQPNAEQSAILELAWATFLAEQPEKAFGLLHAFSAPSFAKSFNPEFFILKTHIYKDHCHYDSAVSAGEQFFSRYQTALDAIYERKDAVQLDYDQLHQVILQSTDVQALWAFAQKLEQERKNISLLWPKATKDELKKLYELKLEFVRWQLGQAIEKQFERAANSLLTYAEEMNLIGYEMGVERFQSSPNSEQIAGQQQQAETLPLKGKVKYKADGEFWNDELKDYIAVLSNDCLTVENWSAR